MLTTLDTKSWSKELVTGNAEFIEADGLLFIISNVREDNTFAVLVSRAVPPSPGPGSQFTEAATFTFQAPNTYFDPVAAYDPTTKLIHIVGTRDNVSGFGSTFGFQFSGVATGSVDLIKFTFNTQTNVLTGPILLVTGTRLRQAYDICVLNSLQYFPQPHTLVSCALTDAIPVAGFAPQWSPTVSYTVGQQVSWAGVFYTCISNSSGLGRDFGVSFGQGDTTPPDLDIFHWAAVPSHRLVAFELDQNDTILTSTFTTIQSSSSRSGNVFGSVSLACTDGLTAELYYEQHPKNVTFKDQVFQILNVNRSVPTQVAETDTIFSGTITVAQASVWVSDISVKYHSNGLSLTKVTIAPQVGEYHVTGQGIYQFNTADNTKAIDFIYGTTPLLWQSSSTQLTSFAGRHTDKRLTVIADAANNRYGVQVFYSQIDHPEGLVGNVILGYKPVNGTWGWHITQGSVKDGSYAQATLSVSQTLGAYIAYLLEPFDISSDTIPPAPAWPLHVGQVDLSKLGWTDIPGFYNQQVFTWLRGTKSTVDDQTLWAIVGERGSNSGNLPVYVSAFNVPPVAVLNPTSTTLTRGRSFLFDARGTSDADNDPITYIWSDNDPDVTNITLTPTANTFGQGQGFGVLFGNVFGIGKMQGPQATLLVKPAVGGIQRTFTVAVAAIDLQADLITPRHNYINVTNVEVVGDVLLVQYNGPLISVGEQVMFWSMQNATFLNNRVVTVTGSNVVEGFGFNFNFDFGTATTTGVFTASVPRGFGSNFGNNFGAGATYASAADAGFGIRDPQFATAAITVPFNAAPHIIFPVNPVNSNRHDTVALVPAISGVTDTDDSVTYLWEQTAGTPVTLVNGSDSSTLIISPLGVSVYGETLTFQLTVNDNVNPPVIASVNVVIVAHSTNQLDTRLLARSVWTDVSPIDAVEINSHGIMRLTVPAPNPFSAGQVLSFDVDNATWLNGMQVTITNVTDTIITAAPPLGAPPLYPLTLEAGSCSAPISIVNRNSSHIWSPLGVSSLATNLKSVHRTSVLDGTDRYILISSGSVLVFGGVHPNQFLLRRLLVPDFDGGLILDAFHTEQDQTLVLTDQQLLYRYSDAPLITTDNPDLRIDLTSLSALTFTKVAGTAAFANRRMLALSGPLGAMLLQFNATSYELEGFIELTVDSNLVYGANNVQWIRFVNMESLRQGRVLLGTLLPATAGIDAITVSSNFVTIVAANNFRNGDLVTFSGLTTVPALNGQTVEIFNATATGFMANFTNLPVATTTETGTTTDLSFGATFETLIDLQHKVILGTWDKSKLRNQFVTSGEILFEQEDSYVGRPVAPKLDTPLVAGTSVTLTWEQQRPDLINSYQLEFSTDAVDYSVLALIGSGSIQSFQTLMTQQGTVYFRLKSFGTDGISPYSNIQAAWLGVLSAPVLIPITQVQEIQFGVFFGANFGGSGERFAVQLSWTDVNPDPKTIDGYTVQISTDGGSFGTIATSSTQTFVTPPLDGGHTYAFRVSAFVPSQNISTLFSAPQSIQLPLAISHQTLLAATVGLAYSFTLKSTGGVAPDTWHTDGKNGFGNQFGKGLGDNLDIPGLSLRADGTIIGTPARVGVFPLEVSVTDSAQPFSLISKTHPGLGKEFGNQFGFGTDLSLVVHGPGFAKLFGSGFGLGNGLGDGFGIVFGADLGLSLNH